VAALGETEQTPRCESRRMSPLPPRVLLIANSAVERSARRQALGRAGFDVETVQTAAEAVEWLAHRQYAAIVADGYVPDMPPLDWLTALRGVATTTPLVVFVEASRQEELSGHAAEFRAAAVLAPLASPAQLVEAVRAALGPAAG
jgi:DNA-binding response OmpR family regulator